MNAYLKFSQLADQVTDEVIAQLEQGKVLWQKPWTSYGLPKNYSSGRHYEGFNAFYLNYITEKNSFATPYFLTFRQAQELGGYVKKARRALLSSTGKSTKRKQVKMPVSRQRRKTTGTEENSCLLSGRCSTLTRWMVLTLHCRQPLSEQSSSL